MELRGSPSARCEDTSYTPLPALDFVVRPLRTGNGSCNGGWMHHFLDVFVVYTKCSNRCYDAVQMTHQKGRKVTLPTTMAPLKISLAAGSYTAPGETGVHRQ